MMRLDKFLADMGQGTRSELKKKIRSGLVTVDGVLVCRPEQKIEETVQKVCIDGRAVSYELHVYYMMNKPAGVITATKDGREQTVLQLLSPEDRRKGLFPVGRLDRDTTGLLLLTDDGPLGHRLLSPSRHVDKTYEAVVEGRATEEWRHAFAEGMDIGDEKPTLPAQLEILEAGELSRIRITLREGRFHQIKRMCQAMGAPVRSLKRLSMGGLRLDESLAPGEYRRLTEEEKAQLCLKKPMP